MKTLKRISLLLIVYALFISSGIFVYADETPDYQTFSQLDERWASYTYIEGSTIGGSGCFITSFAVQMAYANPELRDVNVFNPKILAEGLSFEGNLLDQTSVNNVDSTFNWESCESTSGGDSTELRIKELLEDGKYVIVRAGPPIAVGTTHFSPIVGWDNAKNQPKIMDVAGGSHPTWEEWAPYVNRIDICSSTIQPSLEAYELNSDSIQPNAPQNQEDRQSLQQLINEWQLKGMPSVNSLADFQNNVELKDRDDLSLTEQRRVSEVQQGVKSKSFSLPDWFNHVLFFIGLCLITYSVLLLMATLFDYSNTFIEVSLVSLITLGKCRIVDKDYFKDNISTGYDKKLSITNLTIGMLIFRVIFIMILGIIIMSGVAQEVIIYFINTFMEAVS